MCKRKECRNLKLIILDYDLEYSNRMSHIISELYATRIQLKTFTSAESLTSYLNSSQVNQPFTLLKGEEINIDYEDIKRREVDVYTLVEEADSVEEKQLFKYQPVHQLLNKLMPQRIVTSSHCISFYSTRPGVGKTTLALHTAKQLSLLNKKVLYLNLEMRHSVPDLVSIENNLNLLYYAQYNPQKLKEVLPQAIYHHPLFSSLHLSLNGLDMQACQAEAVEELIKAIQSQNVFDYLLLDLSSDYHPRTLAALTLSDQVIWVMESRDMKLVEQQLVELTEAGYLFFQKALFTINQLRPEESLIEIDRKLNPIALPYIGDWKLNSLEDILSHPIYLAYVQEWFKEWQELQKVGEGNA